MERPVFIGDAEVDLTPFRASVEDEAYNKKFWERKKSECRVKPPPEFADTAPKLTTNCLIYSKHCGDHPTCKLKTLGQIQIRRLSWIVAHGVNRHPTKDAQGNALQFHQVCKRNYCMEPSHIRLNTPDVQTQNSKLAGVKSKISLSDDTVRKIRESRLDPEDPNYKTQEQRAEEFQVKLSRIRSIDQNDSDVHVADSKGKLPTQEKANRRKTKRKERKQKLERAEKWPAELWGAARSYLSRNSVKEDVLEGEQLPGGTSCRVWIGSEHPDCPHYGRAIFNDVTFKAHELSAIAVGENGTRPSTDEEFVNHICDNFKCIEPAHLQFSFQPENVGDTDAKKANSKLTKEKVMEIRRRCYAGERQWRVGEDYGIDQSHVSQIILFKSWPTATNPEIEQKYREYMMFGDRNKSYSDDEIRAIREAGRNNTAIPPEIMEKHKPRPGEIQDIIQRKKFAAVPDVAPEFVDTRKLERTGRIEKSRELLRNKYNHVFGPPDDNLEDVTETKKQRLDALDAL